MSVAIANCPPAADSASHAAWRPILFRQKLPTPKLLTDDQLRRITAPALLLPGAESRIYKDPAKVAARACQMLPGATAEIIPGAGHGLLLQLSDRITARIIDFADTHARA